MQCLLDSVPAFLFLLSHFRTAFTAPSFENFCLLALGAVLAQGRRTVTELLRVTQGLATKHFSTYHRFLSRAVWRRWRLARSLAHLVAGLVPEDQLLRLAGDDTTERRTGSKVYGVACHRDAVRSTQKVLNFCFGHRWVVLSVLVRLPFATRPWALPVLALLYRSPKEDATAGKRHRTLEDLMRIALWLFRRWVPGRELRFVADGGYRSIRMGHFCRRLGIEMITGLHKDAKLYRHPPRRRKRRRGRPPKKGQRLKSPLEMANARNPRWTQMLVEWYGGTVKPVRWLSGVGCRDAPGQPLLEIRWVLVEDLETGRRECFQSTNPALEPQDIIESYVLRWYLETTFQECREHLGLETMRNRVRNSVERSVPCLFGLFSLVTVWYATQHPDGQPPLPARDAWYSKQEVTFSDAIAALRRYLWAGRISLNVTSRSDTVEIPVPLFDFMCDRLARSA